MDPTESEGLIFNQRIVAAQSGRDALVSVIYQDISYLEKNKGARRVLTLYDYNKTKATWS